MVPAGYVGLAIGPLPVYDRDFYQLQTHPRRSKNQIEIAKGIELAKKSPMRRQFVIVGAGKHLRTAQGIFEVLPKHEGEGAREELIAKKIQEPHGSLFHRINEPTAVDELALAGDERP